MTTDHKPFPLLRVSASLWWETPDRSPGPTRFWTQTVTFYFCLFTFELVLYNRAMRLCIACFVVLSALFPVVILPLFYKMEPLDNAPLRQRLVGRLTHRMIQTVNRLHIPGIGPDHCVSQNPLMVANPLAAHIPDSDASLLTTRSRTQDVDKPEQVKDACDQ